MKWQIVLILSCVLNFQELDAFAKEPQAMKIERIPLLSAHLKEEKKVSTVEIKRIDFAALQKTGLHLHPIPVFGTILEGEIEFQVEGEKLMRLKKGDAFFEP